MINYPALKNHNSFITCNETICYARRALEKCRLVMSPEWSGLEALFLFLRRYITAITYRKRRYIAQIIAGLRERAQEDFKVPYEGTPPHSPMSMF